MTKFAEDWDLEELFVLLRSFYPVAFEPEDLGDPHDL